MKTPDLLNYVPMLTSHSVVELEFVNANKSKFRIRKYKTHNHLDRWIYISLLSASSWTNIDSSCRGK